MPIRLTPYCTDGCRSWEDVGYEGEACGTMWRPTLLDARPRTSAAAPTNALSPRCRPPFSPISGMPIYVSSTSTFSFNRSRSGLTMACGAVPTSSRQSRSDDYPTAADVEVPRILSTRGVGLCPNQWLGLVSSGLSINSGISKAVSLWFQ